MECYIQKALGCPEKVCNIIKAKNLFIETAMNSSISSVRDRVSSVKFCKNSYLSQTMHSGAPGQSLIKKVINIIFENYVKLIQ
jgi:hypothetical protein